MSNKRLVKDSEARILVYLNVVDNTRKYVTVMAAKLNIDYSYIMRVLNAMTAKGWLGKHRFKQKVFYYLTENAPLEQATIALNADAVDLHLGDFMEPDLKVQAEMEKAEEVKHDNYTDPVQDDQVL